MAVSWVTGDPPTAAILNDPTLTSVVIDSSEGTKIDLSDLPIENVECIKFEQRTSAPTSPSEGWVYYNATNNFFYFYNGTKWVTLI